MAVPTNLVATPASGLRGGDEIVLTGLNLDLVTSLSFPGVAENVQPASLSEKNSPWLCRKLHKVVALY